MKRRHKRIIFIVCCLGALGFAAWLVFRALGDNLAFSMSPTEIMAKKVSANRVLRVGGLVEKGTLKRDNDGLTLRFAVTDTANTIPVVYKETASHPVPDLFKEGRGCVVQGRVGSDGVFYADQIMAKHDENYMPPEAGKAIDQAKAAKTLVDK
ncbi:MAG TPA: cytochrome c maturation protein CcmE [Blastocatellia bacterium]|jgi:cytochrome c-type biogenesis protein CcmE|nr:cytochrome c maturation protein CcmE [Blastocatellia bacterium]